jgi:hypothetical protein
MIQVGASCIMENFKLVKRINVTPLMAELNAKFALFGVDTSRQQKVPEQRETETIYLRSAVKPYPPGGEGRDVHESRRTKMHSEFPVITAWFESFVKEIGGDPGRATIVKLKPLGCVYRHFDRGEYYRIRDRYHLVLQSEAGSLLTSGDEQMRMQEGELWWFDNKKFHEAYNLSEQPRIHMIFDVLPLVLMKR